MKAAKRMVLDASIAVAWCFADQATSYTEAILDALSREGEAVVPGIWPSEVANALLSAERRQKLSLAQATTHLTAIRLLPIAVEAVSTERSFNQVLPLARQFGLTQYDAAYLEVALRYRLPLATMDVQLKRAAQKSGVEMG
jgi:predicted nucleic acid-binding protein